MNHTQTATSINMMGIAKSILVKLIPLSAAALFASSAFAESCPRGALILERFVQDQNFVRDGNKTNWKLTWPYRAKPSDLIGKTLTNKSLKATPNNLENLHDPKISDLSCNYNYEFEGKTHNYTLTISNHAKLSAVAYIFVKASLTNLTTRWGYDSVAKSRFCPLDGATVADCTFEIHDEWNDPKYEQINGYWDDARWRCGNAYSQCNREEEKMNLLAAKTQKDGCEQLTCSKEINEMNGYVETIAYLHSYGVTNPWWTCWSTDPKNKKGNPKRLEWRQETTAKLTDDRVPSQWGTLYGTREWKKKEDKDQRNIACFGGEDGNARPSGFWPDYGKIGLIMDVIVPL